MGIYDMFCSSDSVRKKRWKTQFSLQYTDIYALDVSMRVRGTYFMQTPGINFIRKVKLIVSNMSSGSVSQIRARIEANGPKSNSVLAQALVFFISSRLLVLNLALYVNQYV